MESFLTVAGALAPQADGAAEGAELDAGAAVAEPELHVLAANARTAGERDLVIRLEFAVESFDRDGRVRRARHRERHVAGMRRELVAAAVRDAPLVAHLAAHDLGGHVVALDLRERDVA